jgi:hypothetical protein
MAPDNKTLYCVVRKYLFCPLLSKFAVASVRDQSALGLRQRLEMRWDSLPPRQEKQINITRATNVTFHQ